MKFNAVNENLFFSTLRIESRDVNSGDESVGTGFLIHVPVQGNGPRHIVLLFTNKHVLYDGQAEIKVTFHLKISEDESQPDLENHSTIGPTMISTGYIPHPNPKVDVAALNITGTLNANKNLFIRTFSSEMFIDPEDHRFVPGIPIYFIGYPVGLYDFAHNLPILRTGILATIPKVDFLNEPTYLVDGQVFQGSSGSPVFVDLSGSIKLVGIISGTLPRDVPVKIIEAMKKQYVEEIVGLGLAFKSSTIEDIINIVLKEIEDKS